MYKVKCSTGTSLFREAIGLIRQDALHYPNGSVSYCFRGESHNYAYPGSEEPEDKSPMPNIYRDKGLIEHESDILNEALRTFPEYFDNVAKSGMTRTNNHGFHV